ncbi:efflux RND transporter periplasmic adaptor subunit [Patescibacteria group bacterium]|nr:MAG: efflux RND transporter periplasmic adaptor subunit [Patescibacteria group bacterium]
MTTEILKTKAGLGILIAAMFLVGGIIYVKFTGKSAYDTVKVVRTDLAEEVSVSGRVKSAQSVDLAFEKGGRVRAVNVKVGDQVFPGKYLVSVDASELLALYRGAQANTLAEKARLDELVRGPRTEEVVVSETKVKNAETLLSEALRNLTNVVSSAYTKSDDGVRNRTEKLFTNPRSSSPDFVPQIYDSRLESTIESQRVAVEQTLVAWKKVLDTLTVENVISVIIDAKKNLTLVKNFLDNVSLAVNSLTPNTSTTQTTIDDYKADLSTARTNVNTAIENLSSAEGEVQSKKVALELAQNDLTLVKAGNTEEQISQQQSKYDQMVATEENYQAQLAKTTIVSPIQGVVTSVLAKVGEIFSANTVAVSLISEAEFHIEVNVPESDISKIVVGNLAEVTLDAYGENVRFPSKVILVDPAETIIDGVPTYKVTLQFLEKDARVRSGMTANIIIKNNPRTQILSVPSRVIFEKNGEKYVKVLVDKKEVVEKKVTTGVRASNGAQEIVSGLSEGEEVIFGVK